MFYSQALLSRKGPLGNIWIAAYCFKKLRRAQIAGTDISSSVDKIMPEVQISYRVFAQLLLGIVRIFSKKVDYLYQDCNEALTSLRKSFTPYKWTQQKKPKVEPQRNVTVAKEVTHAPMQNVTASKEGSPSMQIEAMCASYHTVTITVPQRFELDSFDLEVSDGGDIAKTLENCILEEDEWTNGRDPASFLNEPHHREIFAYVEDSSACFTPVNDVLPSHMMDVDLETSDPYKSSCLEVSREKAREVFQHLEESENHESGGPRKSLGPYLLDEELEHQVHPIKLQETIPSHSEKKVHIEVPIEQAEPVNFHGMPPSPKFRVTTPAKTEGLRMSRKRKNSFDETIVLSNETLRMWIHDASTLVCKRRKAPHTLLDAWKAFRNNLQQDFMEPLIPYIAPELKALLRKKSPEHLPIKKSAGSIVDSANVHNEVPYKCSDTDGLLQERIANDSAAENFSEVSADNKSCDMRIKEFETSLSGRDVMDKELDLHEDSDDQGIADDGWSIRTRVVAQYLLKRFLDLKEQEQKETLGLARILEGQTRGKCARFFYETLTLKNHGCINVTQDSPYGDIMISLTPQMFKD